MAILGFLMLAFYILVLYYLFRLEKIGCKCALDWRRNYIIGFFFVAFVFMIFPIKNLSRTFILIAVSIFICLVIANIIIIFQYVSYLKKEKCKCSESHLRDLLQLVAIIHSIGAAFGVIFIVYLVGYVARYKKIPDLSTPKLSKK